MASSTSNLDLLVQSQAGKEITANALFDAASPSMLFGRRQSTTSGLTWGYYGGVLPVAGAPTVIPNGTISLVASRTQQIEAGFVSTTTTAITGLTLADPCVVTVASHPYAPGDILWIDGLVGTVELNKSFALVTATTATTITLSLSSIGLTAWTSGGTLARVTSSGAVALQIGKGLGTTFVATIPLYQVVVGTTTITSYTDSRVNISGNDNQLSKSIAGSANVILSAGERQNERIEFTGAITANIAVIVPPVVGRSQVINNTTGAYTVTIRTPTGTGVIIPVGVPVDLYCDGTNILNSVDAMLKDTSGGVAGLTLFKINFKNALNTFTSFFTNANTAARTYTFQDRDGTIADNADLAGKAALAGATFTGLVNLAAGADIASAATIDLTAATGNTPRITGTTPTSAVTMNTGQQMIVVADGAWPLVYNATTNKINTGGFNYTCNAGDVILYHKDLSGVVHGLINSVSGYAVGYGTDKAIFGYGYTTANVSMTNLVSNTGVVATDTTGVGTARYALAAAGYGGDKAIFGYGTTGAVVSITNLVSNTGVVATDTTGVGTARYALAAAGYGGDKAIFGYGYSTANVSLTNLVSNTGVVATDTTGVGTARYVLAAVGYGTDKAIFGYGYTTAVVSMTNLVSNTGVVATDSTGVGTARHSLAAAGYGTDKAIFGYGTTGAVVSITNLVSNTGVVATDTTGVGTAREQLAAAGYGGDKAIFGYGYTTANVSMTNLVSSTGVVATDTTGVGTARRGLAAAGYA